MKKIKSLLGYVLFIIGLIGLFSACYTEKRFSRQLSKGVVAYPSVMSNACASLYPNKIETIKEITYREGKVDTIWEDLYLDCDTITEVVWKDRIVKVQVPKIIKKVDTIIDHQYHSVENTALVTSVKLKNDSLISQVYLSKMDASESQSKYKLFLWITIALISYLGIKTILRLAYPQLKFISKLP
jgi:ribosome-binding factor A